EDARAKWRNAYSRIENSDDIPIKPQRVMKELSKFITDEVIVAAGAGRAKMWAASVLPILKPRMWIHSGGYAVMGYELCAALAAKLAKPESKVIAVCGDASFQMHSQELATAVEQESPFLAVVLNDLTLASIRNAQLKKYGKAFGTKFKLDVNLAEVAKAFGAQGERIEKPSDLAEGIRAGLQSSRPYVLDVMIDGTEIPTFEL
ncbi:MAG: thiamine pyrophosphate-dependent enzyme, partial [Thaumarchaeota archaeon]|nr:thiamine pyrophosphate-dependent enzyme [Nitrososphaerota archaeon]